MAGSSSIDLMNLRPPKPPAQPKNMAMKQPKAVGSAFPKLGTKTATPTVKKVTTKAVPKAKKATASVAAPTLAAPSMNTGLAGALAQKNLLG